MRLELRDGDRIVHAAPLADINAEGAVQAVAATAAALNRGCRVLVLPVPDEVPAERMPALAAELAGRLRAGLEVRNGAG